MAARTFTSTGAGTGVWSDPDCWTGGGAGNYPGNSATDTDAVNIGTTAAHTITYDRASLAAPLGTVTIGGASYLTSKLTFSTAASTLMTLGAVNIDLFGILEIDYSAVTAYTATLDFAPSADASSGIRIRNAAAQLILKGNPAEYGSDYDARVAANFTMYATGSTDKTATITGDFSAKWKTGNVLLFHKGTTYASATNDFAVVTLTDTPTFGAGVTTLTFTVTQNPGGEATFNQYGDVLNLSRNVKLTDNGASIIPGNFNTTRPQIVNQTTPTYLTTQAIIDNVDMLGFNTIILNNAKISGCVFRNGGAFLGLYSSQIDIDDLILAFTNAQFAYFSSNVSLDNAYICGTTYANHPLLYDSPLVEGSNIHYFGNSATFGFCAGLIGTLRNVYHYSNAIGMLAGTSNSAKVINGSIGKDSDGNAKPNASNYTLNFGNGGAFLTTFNVDLGGVDPTIQNSNGTTQARFQCQNYNKTDDSHVVWGSWGKAITGTQGESPFPAKRTGGGDVLYQITSYSNLSPARFFRMPFKPIWVTYGEKTLSLWVYHDYGLEMTDANIYVIVDYDVAATTIDQVRSTTHVVNTTWTALEATFTPAVNGWAIPVLYLTLANAGKVYVDQLVEVA